MSALHALYREGATAEPDVTLDRRILDAARAELRAELRVSGATKSRRPAPWWKGWLPVTSAIAVAIVGVSVTWRVMDEQESELKQEMSAVQAEGERASHVASMERPVEAQPSLKVQVPAIAKIRRTDSVAVPDAPMGAPESEAKPAPAAPAAPVAPAVMAPMVAEGAMKKGRHAEKDEVRERRGASAASEAAATADAGTPDVWLKEIRDLRAAGRVAEAAQSLSRFRTRYPDFVLPDDLLNLK